MDCGIYEIKCIDSGRRYVGSSMRMAYRFTEHARMLRKGRHHSIPLQRAWAKYGESAFVMRPLAYLEPHALKETEKRLLDAEFAVGCYNVSRDPTSPMRGLKHTDEWKAKAAVWKLGNKSKTGIPGPLKGQKMTEEQRALRKPRMKATEETKAKMRAARLGVPPANKGIHVTHCKRGHEMTGDNVYVWPATGDRQCRKCQAVRSKERKSLTNEEM
jgi:group I intron endonuclease